MSRLTPTDLLAWSVLHSTDKESSPPTQAPALSSIQAIDPKWIELILGKPDSARMTEIIETINSESPLEIKIAAFDELEMLVESLDNANDLQPLKLWPTLLSFLLHTESQVRRYTAWIMGTAVQNNEKAQTAFQNNQGIELILNAFVIEIDCDVQLKIIYCLSAAIRTHLSNFRVFVALDGISILVKECMNGNLSTIKRILFLFTALIEDNDTCTQTLDEIDVDFITMILELQPSIEESDDNNYDLGFVEQSLHFINALTKIETPLKKLSEREIHQINRIIQSNEI